MRFNQTEYILYSLLTILCLFFSLKDLNWGFEMVNGVRHSRINNFIIFSNAFTELSTQGNLYVSHPDIHYDYYKYTLTFAFFMAPFSMLPLSSGLVSWNLLNLWVFIIGVKMVPRLSKKATVFIVLFSVFELMGSIQNEQSNGLMTGLILLFFGLMERNKPMLAIICLVISVYVKLFSIVFFVFLLFYPNLLKNIIKSLAWLLIFFILPLIYIGLDYFSIQYSSWLRLLTQDHTMSYGYSVMGIFDSWFGLSPNKLMLVAISFILSIAPLVKYKSYDKLSFRYSMLGIFLIWVVIYNHKSESPLFILAMTGIAVWFVSNKKSIVNKVLVIFSLLFVSFAFSELMPRDLMEGYFYKYSLKALPALLIWVKIIFDLMFNPITDESKFFITESI